MISGGKIERFHETLKARMNLLVYTSPDELRRTMQDFIVSFCGLSDTRAGFYGVYKVLGHRPASEGAI